MSRADRRWQEREYARFNKKFNKLNGPQKELANKVGREVADMYIKKLLDGLDRSVSAAAILSGADMKKANEVTFLVGKLLGEDTYKVQEFENQFIKEEDCQMAIKKIDEEVKREVEKLINEGVNKKEAIEKLVFKFPKLSKSMLTNAYQRVKEEIQTDNKNTQDEDSEVTAALEYIFEEKEVKKEVEKSEVNDKDVQALEESAEKIIEEAKKMQCKDVANNAPTESKLQVLEEVKIVKVKGENGIYEAETGKGVILSSENASICFQNEEQLNEWVSEFKEVFNMVK